MKKLLLLITAFMSSIVFADEEWKARAINDILSNATVSAIEEKLESCTNRSMDNDGRESIIYDACYHNLVKDIRFTIHKCKSNKSINKQACEKHR